MIKVMEDKNISERESLELISKMILQTKEDLNVGSGSIFLVWGYVCCGIGLLVWLLMVLGSIGNVAPCFYTLIPILGFVIDKIVRKKSENGFVKNYSTYMIDSTWMILSGAFGIAAIVCVYFCVMHNMMNALVFSFLVCCFLV